MFGRAFTYRGIFANANLFRASIRSECPYDIGEQLKGAGPED